MSQGTRFDLTGKTALVTGGSRGIGRGIALALAEHGADVAIVYAASSTAAEEVVGRIKSMGRKAWLHHQDLGELDALAGLADRVWNEAGKIDFLVNNAAQVRVECFNRITPEIWRRMRAVNLDAVFFLTQRVAERMIAAGIRGRIINISSKNGFVASAQMSHYNTFKGALELLTQSLAIELGQHGITVNSLAPGDIDKEPQSAEKEVTEFGRHLREHIPLEHRLGLVEECAGPVVFLASEAASYMNGQHLIVDGGFISQQVPRMQFMAPYRNTLQAQDLQG